MRRTVILSVASLVLATIALDAVGAHAISRPRITRFTATLEPDPLSTPSVDPDGRVLGITIRFDQGSPRSVQRRMEVLLPAGVRLNFQAFNVCAPGPHIKRACIVAFGSSPQAGFNYFSVVNGPPVNGSPSLWVKWGTAIASASYAGVAAPYGEKLTINIPRTHRGRHGFKLLKFFTMIRAAHGPAPGSELAFLQQVGPCPTGGQPVRVGFTFANGRTAQAAATAKCSTGL